MPAEFLFAFYPLVLGAVGLVILLSIKQLFLGKRTENLLLIAFALSFALPAWNTYTINALHMHGLSLHAAVFHLPWLTAGLLYLYLRQLFFASISPFLYAINTAPFAIAVVYFTFMESVSSEFYVETIACWNLLTLIYVVAFYRLLRGFKTLYQDNYSDEIRSRYRWSLTLAYGLALFSICDMLFGLALMFRAENIDDALLFFEATRSAYLVLIIAYAQRHQIDKEKTTNSQSLPLQAATSTSAQANSEARLTETAAEALKSIFNQALEKDELYLQASLSLRELADHLEVSAHDLSELLNTHMHSSFYNTINAYRVEHAKNLLKATNKTAIDIAYASGFNNKTSFYKAFKKTTGATPSDYRSKMKRNRHGVSIA